MYSLRKTDSLETLNLVSCRQEEEGGCFRRQLLIDCDDLSTDSNDSYSDDFSRQGGTNECWPHFSFKHTSSLTDVVQPAEPPTYLFNSDATLPQGQPERVVEEHTQSRAEHHHALFRAGGGHTL